MLSKGILKDENYFIAPDESDNAPVARLLSKRVVMRSLPEEEFLYSLSVTGLSGYANIYFA